ncbi:MAG: hypothetical protein OXQ27_12180, partial [Chloroflexota bacterium]|nr:hypothetical protein [Chloroflexota bacterium]
MTDPKDIVLGRYPLVIPASSIRHSRESGNPSYLDITNPGPAGDKPPRYTETGRRYRHSGESRKVDSHFKCNTW